MQSTRLGIWWHHQMETFSTLLALYQGNPPVTGGFPSQRPVMQSFDVSFDVRLNKRLSKPWRCWRFEMPWCSLWRQRNAILLLHYRWMSMMEDHCQKWILSVVGGLVTGVTIHSPGHQVIWCWLGERSLNIVRTEKYGHHFADNMFTCISVKYFFCIVTQISLTFILQAIRHYLNQNWPNSMIACRLETTMS